MDKQRLKWWAIARTKGRRNYILRTGVGLWGVPVGLIWSVWMAAMMGWDKLVMYLLIGLVVISIGGWFVGNWMWIRMEDEYQKELAQKDNSN